jgi:hypothetical protein
MAAQCEERLVGMQMVSLKCGEAGRLVDALHLLVKFACHDGALVAGVARGAALDGVRRER